MAQLDVADREMLDKRKFAYVDKNGEGHLPIHDEAYVRRGRQGRQREEAGQEPRGRLDEDGATRRTPADHAPHVDVTNKDHLAA